DGRGDHRSLERLVLLHLELDRVKRHVARRFLAFITGRIDRRRVASIRRTPCHHCRRRRRGRRTVAAAGARPGKKKRKKHKGRGPREAGYSRRLLSAFCLLLSPSSQHRLVEPIKYHPARIDGLAGWHHVEHAGHFKHSVGELKAVWVRQRYFDAVSDFG